MNIGIILAGGKGTRLKTSLPKQFMSLNGKPVFYYAAQAMYESKLFDKIIMVLDKQYASLVKDCPYISALVEGGKTRTLSVYNAIQHCKTLSDVKYVLFHDAARPFIKATELKQYITALKQYQGAITAQPITDALFYAPREDYKLIQTPEAFRFQTLVKKFNEKNEHIAIYEHIYPANIKFINLNHLNLKITIPEDFFIAEQLMKYRPITTTNANVKNKTVLLLGGSGGIGKSIQKILTSQGATVIAPSSSIFKLDVSPFLMPSDFGKIKYDCIIHSAGAYATDNDGLLAHYNEIMNVNFSSIVQLVELAPRLLKPGGTIVCVGSTAAAKGRAGISLYSASKAALNCFAEGISTKLLSQGFKINIICPAKVATKLQKKINPNAKLKDMIQPDDIAKIIIRYINTDRNGDIVFVRVGEEK